MNLPEIFVELPLPVAFSLEHQLESINLPANPTKNEVLLAAALVIDRVLNDCPIAAGVTELLQLVPEAIVQQLFPAK